MADLKPPRLVGDERSTLLALLQYTRESIVRKVDGVSDDDARRSPVSSGTSLLWLLEHLSHAERLWIVHRFAGDELVPPPEAVTVVGAVDAYRTTWTIVDRIVAASSLDDVCRNIGDDPPVSLRWVLVHLLEETARHAGHADILRELLDGRTGR
jgi:hypothetical protein